MLPHLLDLPATTYLSSNYGICLCQEGQNDRCFVAHYLTASLYLTLKKKDAIMN